MVLSFSCSKVISVHYSGQSISKEGRDKGVHVCGFSVVRQDSRPLLGVINDFPSTAPGNLPPIPVYSQRKIDL